MLARHGHSMEEETGDILRSALKHEGVPLPRLGSHIAARFIRHGLTEDLSVSVINPWDT